MCGLIGYFCKKSINRALTLEKRKYMWDGLYMSALRGTDATGLAFVREADKNPVVYKRAVPASDFLQLKMTDKILTDVDEAVAILGHTRSATKGWVSDEHSHPFQFKHITLIHNGHITNHRQLRAVCDSEVDSAHVAAALADAESEVDVIQSLYGDYALCWHNSKDGTINFARNKGRPLYWIEIPSWDGIIFGSEWEMLAAVCSRNGIKTVNDMFKYPTEGHIWKFPLNKIEQAKKIDYLTIPFSQKTAVATGPPRDTRGRWEAALNPQSVQPGKNILNGRKNVSWKTGTDSELFKRYSNVKETSLKGSGRPLTERQENKARSRLKRFKLVYDTVHGLDAVDFIPYKDTKDWGTVLCSFIGYHSDKLGEIRHVSRTTFDAVSQQVNILCRLVNVQNWGKKQEETILLEFDGNYLEGALKDYHDNDIRNNIAIIYKGPAGLLSKGRFLEIVKNGCAVCNDPININFHAEIKWTTGTDEPICHKCCSDPHIMEEYGELLQKTH